MNITENFDGDLFHKHWTQVTTGGGKLSIDKAILRMSYESAQPDSYTDTQIDDYTMVSKSDYLWKPPLRMTVRARASHQAASADSTEKSKNILRGTAGFGFWNKPFTMQGQWSTLPESVWFFYSAPPSNMALVPGLPGWGWKAQVVHSKRLTTIPSGVQFALTAGYARLTGDTKLASRWLQRVSNTHEALIEDDMTAWHTYTLEWRERDVKFWVDGELILRTSQAPTQPLGFVAWLDNEYAIVTPQGQVKFGKTQVGAQWLDVDNVKIEHL